MSIDVALLKQKFHAKQIKVIHPEMQLCSLRLSSSGQLAAGSFTGVIRRWAWNSPNLEELPPLSDHQGWVQAVEFSHDGKKLFSVDSFGSLIGWDVSTKEGRKLWHIKEAHNGWIHSLALSPNQERVATAGRDGFIKVRSTKQGESVTQFQMDHPVHSLIFSPDGKSLIAGDSFGIIKQFDLEKKKEAREFDARAMYLLDRIQDVGGVRSFTFSTDGNLLIASGCKPKSGGFVEGRPIVLAFDWSSGKLQHSWEGTADNEGFAHQVRWHKDGFLIMATSGQPGVGKISMQLLGEPTPFWSQTLPNVHSFAISPDDQFLFVMATNANSAGNGRNLNADKVYLGNFSPIHIFQLGVPETKKKS